ncbi:MAG: N-acetylmuramoyl-L-alanine amidase [Melioribacteraceae bacterium]|nr:N-acetylmuramoyl-L-alanine amidase [Melioribacteraceae bacterium]
MKLITRTFLAVLILAGTIQGQRMLKLSVESKGETKYLSYINRNGITYTSTREWAELLDGSYYYSKQTGKIELKFENHVLKVTGRNQFVIVAARDYKSQSVFQIPISTLLVSSDVLIPLEYTLKYIKLASGREILFNEKEKHIAITGKPYVPVLSDDLNIPVADEKKETQKVKIDSDYDIYELVVEEKSNGTLMRLKSQKQVNRFSSSIQDGKLRLFISNATVDPDIVKDFKSVGFVKNAEYKNVKDNIQLEFPLKPGYSIHEAIKDIESNDIIITIHSKVFSNLEKDLGKEKAAWNLDVVVIDPGHGGKDGGAVGVTGVKEKDINLKIALKLGSILKKQMPDVKVVFTRDDDRFVELYQRGKIANENDGKLFISIHCNSLAKKGSSTKGFEAYLLRPGKTKQAIEIAEFENSVISLEDNPDRYQALTDENFILVSMAHSAYMRYSEKFSELLNRNWMKRVKEIPSRGIKQAGFYVLVGASMPGVLIETGFISNYEDESYLNSSKGQQSIAESVFHTIKEYKAYYDAQIESES